MREVAVSAAVNGMLSIAFYLLIFVYRAAPAVHALALDFLQQAFMVSLMSSVISP